MKTRVAPPQAVVSEELARRITIHEAARWHGVHPKTIRRWIAEGILTGYRTGGHLIRLDANEVASLGRPIPGAGHRSA